MMKPLAPEQHQSGPKSSDAPIDEAAPLPTAEDDGQPPPADQEPPRGQDEPPAEDDAGKPARPEKPPSDEIRDKIAARFSRSQTHTPGGDEDDAQPEADAGAGAEAHDQQAAPPRLAAGQQQPAVTPAAEADGSNFTLKVRGKDFVKNIDEIAELAEMTPEEVRANPARAVRFAQKELAAESYLDEAKQIRRESVSRSIQGEPDSRAGRRAPDQEPDDSGNADGPDQQRGGRNTSDLAEKAKTLIEDIQIGSPEEAAEKLVGFLNNVVENTTNEALSKKTQRDMASNERRDAFVAMREVVEEHPEIRDDEVLSDALSARIIREQRADLRKCLLAEGESTQGVDDLLSRATVADIAAAHEARRVAGDPNVRKLNKAFFNGVYEAVSTRIQGGNQQRQSSTENLQAQRVQRKENLTPQPRRASVPPAQQPAAVKPQSRSQAVAELAAARGQKGPSKAR